ncbi:NTP transferase domain-containing protein [Pseudogemmobacter sonorensis]|uniref:NTP transferase domain-containing protein n=1 Tax=Pseudogemmobacter sonorensis TaxID=2989681 RepID=UPI0036AA2A6E
MAGIAEKTDCLGVLLAAGASRRFGPDDKLLASYGGAPLVVRAARALGAAGCDRLAAIVSSPGVAAALPEGFAGVFVEPDQPMAVSFRRAIDLARETGAARLLICLGDMPNLPVDLLRRLRGMDGSAACLAEGVRMPPMLLLARDYAAAREGAEGDRGARRFLATLPESALLALTPEQARDIDRPADIDAPDAG